MQQAQAGGSYYDGLVGTTSRLEGFPTSVRVANKLTSGCFQITVGDFVARNRELGVVLACAEEHGVLHLIVDTMAKTADVTTNAVKVRSAGVVTVWRAAEAKEGGQSRTAPYLCW